MNALNQSIAAMPIPPRIRRLPVSPAGFPVPWFVQWFDGDKPTDFGVGTPDFRVADERKLVAAIKQKRCWVCGEPTGVRLAFTIGPMCAINRTISEPPQHFECAQFSAKACPFLSQPKMRRNEKDLPTAKVEAAGMGIKRNPTAVCVWVTRSYRLFRPHAGNPGVLFRLGEPESIHWFAKGREATRAEVWASIESGLPILKETAASEGPDALKALDEYVARAMPLLPPEITITKPSVLGQPGENA
jgi:hypothetical protein